MAISPRTSTWGAGTSPGQRNPLINGWLSGRLKAARDNGGGDLSMTASAGGPRLSIIPAPAVTDRRLGMAGGWA